MSNILRQLKAQKRIDRFLVFAILIFSFLNLPFIGLIPYLDGNIDFVQVNDFYSGGLSQYFANWRSVHPPFKLILGSLFFKLGGVSSFSYTAVGFIFGIIGIVSIFYLTKELFNKQTAQTSCILLAASPLFIATGVFFLRDYLLTILIILSLFFYTKRGYVLYTIFASLIVLTKEAGLAFIGSIIVVESLYSLKRCIKTSQLKGNLKFIFFLIPLFISSSWIALLKLNGKHSWREWIFSETASKGTYYTLLNNLLNFNFLNKYAYQHWRQLFFLNFNWVYWLIVLIGSTLLLIEKKNRSILVKQLRADTTKAKTLLIIGLFTVIYFLTVLCLQTYTIPRYALPLTPFLLMTTSFIFRYQMKRKPSLKPIMSFFLGLVVILSLFFSIDPVSLKLWGKTKILGEDVYALNQHLAGNDGITYNIQYLFIAKKRTKQITEANKKRGPVVSNECHWIFPDRRNDYLTMKILKLKDFDLNYPCQTINGQLK